jgi:hypothetical protein
MKSSKFPTIEFCETQRLNPQWSSWVCFTETIWKRNGLSKRTINKAFDKLVEKDDYSKSDRKPLLYQLYELSEGRLI